MLFKCVEIRGKVIAVPEHHTVKVYRQSGDKVPFILNLGIRWM